MQIIRFLLFPFALIYGFIVLLRNFFYDSRFFKSSRFSMPIICVGNLSMGGTGKTPHTEYLIRLLKDKYKVATLSRGFGRKERDFRIADNHATALNLGDEPLQYHLKFKDEITVAVEANRVHGVMDICLQKPETNLILLDDAYQHRAIHAGFKILLTSYNEPFYSDFMVPLGNLREFRAGKKRADVVIVTKCPDFGKINKAEIAARLKLLPAQRLFFSRINYGKLISLKDASALENSSGNQIVLVTGIANSKSLVDQLSINNEILHHFNYRDHHTFSVSDLTEIHNLFDKFASPQTILVTTEKDAMRLIKSEFEKTLKNYPWYYQEIQVELDNSAEFDKLILEYAEKIVESVEYIHEHAPFAPEIGIVLGTGLGGLVKEIDVKFSIDYSKIPHFPLSTVESHSGKLIFGELGGKRVIAMQGRFHYYEGYTLQEVTFPIRVMKMLGIKNLFLSNASGGVNPDFKIGEIMILNDHINLFPCNPLIGKNLEQLGPRFPDMSDTYDKNLIALAKTIAKENGIDVSEGVYAGLTGPTLETPAEYHYIRVIGADAVGMSTVPEVIVARHMDIPVFAVSIVTDLGVKGKIKKVSVQDVIDVASQQEPKMTFIMKELISRI